MRGAPDRPRARRLLVGALLLSAARPAAAQVLTGRVSDDASRAPVTDVRLAALAEDGSAVSATTSDTSGQFVLRLPAGRYRLRLERLGYQPLTTVPVKVSRGEVVTMELRLAARAIALEPLVVTARVRPPPNTEVFERRRAQYGALGAGRFMTRAGIDSLATASVHTLLARDPAVRILRSEFNEVVAFAARGRSCLPALFLDGVRVQNGPDTDLGAWVQPDQVEGVEIYPNEAFAPPELRVEGCGSLAIWTRSSRGNPFGWKKLALAAGFIGLAVLATR